MKFLSHSMIVMSVFGFVGNSLFAAPEPGEQKSQDIFQQLDKNSDGTITAEEVPEDKERFFDHLIRSADKNKDGKLSQDEFRSRMKKEEQKFPAGEAPNRNRDPRAFQMMLKRLDKNGDKKITKEELPEPLRDRLEPLFKRLGKDEISLEEFAKFASRFRGNGNEGRRQQNPGERAEGALRFFDMLDTNKDGKLTLDEAPERGKPILRRLLEKAAKDEDGELTKEEFKKELADFRPQRRPGDKEMKKPEMRGKEQSRGDNASRRRPAPALMMTLDTNRDGLLSKDELNKIGQAFDQLDRNKDGVLDLSEIWFNRDRNPNSPRRGVESKRKRGKGENRQPGSKKKDSKE